MNFAGSAIRFGWETFKKRPWFFVGVYLLIGIISSGLQFQTSSEQVPEITAMIVTLFIVGAVIGFTVQILIKMGSTEFVLKAEENPHTVSFRNLWAPHPFWKYVGGAVLVGGIVLLGFILLIIPGIIWSLRYMFVPYLIMERKLGPIEALRESARITYGHKWQLLGLLGLAFLVNLLGFLCLLVGLLVTIPVTALAIAHAYRTLSKSAHTPVS
ncbi:MAG: DUF975 family protein [bacterium]|nr:DUF975 family protein [bacterium]